MPVYKRKNVWWVRFQIKRKRIAFSVPEARNREQAKQAEAKAKSEAFTDRYGAPTGDILLKDLIEKHFLPWSMQEKRSWRSDVSRVKPIMAYFKKKKLKDITRFTVEHYRRHRQGGITCRGKARSLASIDREVQLLSRIFGMAIEKNLITANPCTGIKLLAPNVGAPRYLLREEEEKLRPHLTGRRAHLLDILDINLSTGMRRGEILTLHTSQVDFSRASIEITGKGNKKRPIPIHPDLVPLLRRLCDNAGTSGYLFENPKTGRPRTDIKKAWKAALVDAGIDHLPFHCAGRHTFATRAVDGGAPITAVSAVLGHSDLKTTMRYAHATDEGRRRVVEAAVGGPTKVLEFPVSGTNVVRDKKTAAS